MAANVTAVRVKLSPVNIMSQGLIASGAPPVNHKAESRFEVLKTNLAAIALARFLRAFRRHQINEHNQNGEQKLALEEPAKAAVRGNSMLSVSPSVASGGSQHLDW
jgi:hypothetical protein